MGSPYYLAATFTKEMTGRHRVVHNCIEHCKTGTLTSCLRRAYVMLTSCLRHACRTALSIARLGRLRHAYVVLTSYLQNCIEHCKTGTLTCLRRAYVVLTSCLRRACRTALTIARLGCLRHAYVVLTSCLQNCIEHCKTGTLTSCLRRAYVMLTSCLRHACRTALSIARLGRAGPPPGGSWQDRR